MPPRWRACGIAIAWIVSVEDAGKNSLPASSNICRFGIQNSEFGIPILEVDAQDDLDQSSARILLLVGIGVSRCHLDDHYEGIGAC